MLIRKAYEFLVPRLRNAYAYSSLGMNDGVIWDSVREHELPILVQGAST